MDNFHIAKNNFLQGLDFLKKKNYVEAEALFSSALSICPSRPSILINLSLTKIKLNKYLEAKQLIGNILDADPTCIEAHLNLGLIQTLEKDYSLAINSFNKALAINPNYAEALLNKGAALRDLRQYDAAINCLQKALIIHPEYVEALNNLGITLFELNQYDKAIASYQKALAIDPENVEILNNMGTVLATTRRFDQALLFFEKALEVDPNCDFLLGTIIFTKKNMCDWDGLEPRIKKLTNQIKAQSRACSPFALLSIIDSPELQLSCSRIWVENKFPINNALGAIPKMPPTEKIRIGYYSADFNNHAVSILTAQVFELHDRSQFEIFAFSFGVDDGKSMRQRLITAFDHFIEVGHLSDLEIAQKSRELGINIAVDLGGHTENARTGIFSFRAAPIQVNHLGFPGTMGAPYIDYILADPILIPPSSRCFYSEKIAYLPNCFQPNDQRREISSNRLDRLAAGLPEAGFAYCCFNNSYKINPTIFGYWMKVLQSVENSVLWLLSESVIVKNHLLAEAERHNVDPKRLIFGERLAPAEYLARYRSADLFLDAIPFNGGTTASDALWAGLPILTLQGKSFAARMASSLLENIGLSDLITQDEESYIKRAIEIGKDPNVANDLKNRLATNLTQKPLFNTPLFTKHLEKAYQKMYGRYQNDLEPETLNID